MIGSCFTENIGEKLRRYKFSTLENPHGILFNPVSVCEAISDCIQNNSYETGDLFCLNEGWHSWKHHSRFSGLSPEEAVEKINTSISTAHIYLKQADFCFITLGSAWVYTLTGKADNAEIGSIAANNHKSPADWFSRRLLSAAEVEEELSYMLQELHTFNPDCRVIFTISPVRHLREGVIDNNRSKAVLIQAVHSVIDNREGSYYFPAYELVLDDLRDYRYFSEDLVHPNYFATQYVWEKFIGACTDEKTKALMEEIERINAAYNHKPFNPTSEQHKTFMRNMHTAVLKMEEQYPYLDFNKEKAYFSC